MFDNLTQKFTTIFDKLAFRGRLTEKNVEDACQEVRTALLEADVNIQTVRDFVGNVRDAAVGQQIIKGVNAAQQFVKIIHDRLVELLGEGTDDSIHYRTRPPTIILLAGLQGSGKTTTAAKLARLVRDRDAKRPLLVACDTYRPAAVEQLKVLGGELAVPVYYRSGADPVTLAAEGVEEARRGGEDVVIIDTAGRLHIDEEMMQEVDNIAVDILPQEIFLVVDAMTGQDAVNSAREFNERLEISGLILTKLDSDARGGAALSIRHVTGKPIRFAGVSEKLDGIEPFHGDRMAGRILGMGDVVGLVEKAQEVIDEQEALAMQRKLVENTFTLDDLMQNLRQVKRMGSISDLLGMIPGVGGRLAGASIPDSEFKRLEAIISSMTLAERTRPEIIDNSRRFRIARGSGTSVADVNALIKQYNEMRRLFGSKGGFGAAMQNLAGMMQGGKPQLPGDSPEDRVRQLRSDRERKRKERRKKKKNQRKQKRRR
ncbi:MAG: signal recognition particle protein [Planctomycetes bacterium]|nr:signal recognition particle protein [Planctomycetota bacterium]